MARSAEYDRSLLDAASHDELIPAEIVYLVPIRPSEFICVSVVVRHASFLATPELVDAFLTRAIIRINVWLRHRLINVCSETSAY